VSGFDALVQRVHEYHPSADVKLIEKAYNYAEWAHREQSRRNGEPYFVHPSHVAEIITELRLDTASICAALLHDVVEDTDTTIERLRDDFGEEVASLVDGVTKLGKINFVSREDRQAESFRKMVVAMARDIRVLLIKLCDRLDNMRTLEFMKPEAQERIARETMEIYAPLSGRLGIHRLKAELEDLSFQYLEPDTYAELGREMEKTHKDRERYIETVCHTLTTRLSEQGFAADVTGRAKHLFSIQRKLRDQNTALSQLYDLIAFRICVETVSDCYAVLGVVHSRWMPIPGRFKDFVALPKSNGYRSLHTALIGPGRKQIEIQIRTHEMHRVAEYGVAAHWRYKERTGGIDPKDVERFGWLRELAEFQRQVKDPVEFLENVKIDIFPEEVYVFTPKGDVRVLPRGATPIDFAFAIHSEVGQHCVGARANGQIVPLRHKLRSGDTIEIVTSPTAQPNRDWLGYCRTQRALTKIRNFLRAEQRQKTINLGRELVESEMRAIGLSYTKFIRNEGEVRRVCAQFKVGNLEELLLTIGHGKVPADEIVAAARSRSGQSETEPPPDLREGKLQQLARRITGRDHSGIRVSGQDDVLVRFARCCNPLPGDAIIGFITRGRGITVHRRQCVKTFDLDPERRIDVSWDTKAKVNRPVQLRVTTASSGILAVISQVFSAQRVNISEANCRAGDDGRACNTFTFTVSDLDQLRDVMRDIRAIVGVVEVERI
jgi:GTP diphosphokinase / guanosine-3',5'-bis(diphosphate) 3'-diphosphatase